MRLLMQLLKIIFLSRILKLEIPKANDGLNVSSVERLRRKQSSVHMVELAE
jgi:hypothetical protein